MDLTIFISTFNRPKFIDLLFFYFKRFEFNCDFVILDGSEKKFRKLNLKILKKYRNLFKGKIIYKHSDKQLSEIYNFASKVKTKFCLLTNDDDVPGKKFITESIEFLNKNKNLVTTNGYIATSNIKFYRNNFKIKNYKFSNYPRIDINRNFIDKRFLQFNYKEGFAFSIYRSSDFKNIFRIIQNCCRVIKNPIKKIEHIVSFKLMTIAFSVYNLFRGKIKVSNRLMMTRINHQFNQSSSINYYDPLGGYHVIDFHKDNTKYFDTLVKELSYVLGKKNISYIKNFVYLHVFIDIGERLPRLFYKTHKDFDPSSFNLSQKLDILKFFPKYYYFRLKNILSKFNLYENLKFNFKNFNEIKNLKNLKKDTNNYS